MRKRQSVFAWSHTDMPGIDPKVMSHKLNVTKDAKPIKQRRIVCSREKYDIIREEVKKLEEAEFIREVTYSEWLSNAVIVPKANGKWRMCVDFIDLNKSYPKDSFKYLGLIRWWTQQLDMSS